MCADDSYDNLVVDEEGMSKNLTVALYAVALVRLDAGAEMGSLTVESDNGRPTSTTLYIDLNGGKPGDEDGLDVHGFLNENVFFITKKKQKVQLKSVRIPDAFSHNFRSISKRQDFFRKDWNLDLAVFFNSRRQ